MSSPIPDEVLRQIERPGPGSDGPRFLECVTGRGVASVVHHVSTSDLARELLTLREGVRLMCQTMDAFQEGVRALLPESPRE